jgi:hypothetical protein
LLQNASKNDKNDGERDRSGRERLSNVDISMIGGQKQEHIGQEEEKSGLKGPIESPKPPKDEQKGPRESQQAPKEELKGPRESQQSQGESCKALKEEQKGQRESPKGLRVEAGAKLSQNVSNNQRRRERAGIDVIKPFPVSFRLAPPK